MDWCQTKNPLLNEVDRSDHCVCLNTSFIGCKLLKSAVTGLLKKSVQGLTSITYFKKKKKETNG